MKDSTKRILTCVLTFSQCVFVLILIHDMIRGSDLRINPPTAIVLTLFLCNVIGYITSIPLAGIYELVRSRRPSSTLSPLLMIGIGAIMEGGMGAVFDDVDADFDGLYRNRIVFLVIGLIAGGVTGLVCSLVRRRIERCHGAISHGQRS